MLSIAPIARARVRFFSDAWSSIRLVCRVEIPWRLWSIGKNFRDAIAAIRVLLSALHVTMRLLHDFARCRPLLISRLIPFIGLLHGRLSRTRALLVSRQHTPRTGGCGRLL